MKQDPIDTSIQALRSLSKARPPAGVEARIAARALQRLPGTRGAAAPAPQRRWLVPALGLSTALAIAVAVAVVVQPVGDRSAAGPTATPEPALADLTLPSSGPVRSTAESPTTFRVGSHLVELAAGAELLVEHAEPDAVDLRVEAGLAGFKVHHLAANQSFKVRTDQVLVEVVGTRFSVESLAACSVVAVEEGRVRITDGNGIQASLGAGGRQKFCEDPESTATEALLREALVLVSSGSDLERAADLLARFRQRQPGPALDEEALFHLCLVEARLGRVDQAHALAEEFRTRFPGSHRGAQLDRWLEGRSEER